MTRPLVQPLTLSEAKAHLRIATDNTDDDAYVTRLIEAAAGTLESVTGRAMGSREYRLTLSAWPDSGRIYLPYPPLVTVDEIVYIDEAGASQTLTASDYALDDSAEPALLTPPYNQSWPTVQQQPGAIRIDYTAGYTSTPAALKHALLLLIGHWYENREAIVTGTIATDLPLAVQYIVDEYSVRRFILP